MQLLQRLFGLLVFFICYQTASAQGIILDINVETTYAIKIGKTKPVSELIAMPALSPEKKALNKSKKIIPNFIGRGYRPEKSANALPKGADKLWQKNLDKGGDLVVEPLVNVEGVSNSQSGATPPDPTGAIGKNHYMQAVNATHIQVFDKEGNKVGNSFTANTIWSSIGFSSAGDPIILYDQEYDRWILTEFPNGNQLLVAISEDEDPLGSYTAYNFSTPNFPDYPKYSIWPNALVVTTNEQGPGNLPSYFIDRAGLMNGDAVVNVQRLILPGISAGPGFQVATPVNWDGSNKPPADAKPMILTIQDDGWGLAKDQIVVHSIDVDFENSANTTVTAQEIETSPFDTYPCSAPGFGFACIPQLNGNGIDGLPEVLMFETHYRNFNTHESMVMNFITDVNGNDLSGIRWIEMRRLPGESWTVYQEGTFAPDDGLHRFMGSIAIDARGNIALAYSVSSETIHPELRFTGRLASDPLGEMTVEEYVITPGSSVNPSSRYGDYAQMNVDPVNEKTFWFTGEYRAQGGWGTKVVAFEFQQDTIDIGPTIALAPSNDSNLGATEMVSVSIKNFGLDTQHVYKAGFQFENGAIVKEDVDMTIAPGESYAHTFAPTVDMSNIGEYNFTFFTELIGDEAVFNDTLKAIIYKLSSNDAGIRNIIVDNIICGADGNLDIEITNYGQETLTSASIELFINGGLFITIPWTGSLAYLESEFISVPISGLVDGENIFLANTTMPNGVVDEIPTNDAFEVTGTALLNGTIVSLVLNTDNYPDETTWEVSSLDGMVLYSGGPYNNSNNTYSVDMCLDSDLCYDFVIYDSYGDGICCTFGNGNYGFYDPNGAVLLYGDGDFGNSESGSFCATFECLMSAEVISTPASGDGISDGTIMINITNGNDPVQYSIDGGVTFQSGSIFTNLPPGSYDIVVLDNQDCNFESTIELDFCTLQFSASVTDATNSNSKDGSIEINVDDGNTPYEYSIDGGTTYGNLNTFDDLDDGTYIIVVRDSLGCEVLLTVEVKATTAVETTVYGQLIKVFPNPNNGVFRIEIEGDLEAAYFLDYEIMTIDGRIIQTGQLAKYDQKFTGLISLAAQTNGSYYVRLIDPKVNRLIHIIKQ